MKKFLINTIFYGFLMFIFSMFVLSMLVKAEEMKMSAHVKDNPCNVCLKECNR